MAFMDYMPQFGQNTDQQMPQDDAMMQLELQRRMKFADALRQQAAPEGQMVSGHYVAPSWTQQLAGLANKYVANQNEQQAMKQYGQYQQGKTAKLADLLAGKETQTPVDYNESGNIPGMTQTTRTPYNQQEFLAKAVQAMPDLAPKLIESQIAQYGKEETPISLGEGGVLVNRKGDVIASNPKAIKEEKMFGNINPSDFTPQSLAKFAQTKNYSDLQITPKQMTPYEQASLQLRRQEVGNQKAPAGYTWNAQGGLIAIPGGPADKTANPTESQANANLFGARAQEAHKILQGLTNKFSPAAIQAQESVIGNLPGVGYLINKMASPETQSAAQAERNFVNAILRKESGASISSSEFDQARKQYFPQPGDNPATIAQKAANRETAIKGIMAASGPLNQTAKPQVRTVDW